MFTVEKRNHFKPVLFVASTSALSSVHEKVLSSPKDTSLDGAEIRQFYEDVINSPPVSGNVTCSKPVKRRKSSQNLNCKQQRGGNVKSSNTMFKCAETGDLEGMKQCLNYGLDVNSTDTFGWTCLMCAACSGSKEMVKFLLKSGAQKDLRNSAGKSAIDLANEFEHKEVVKVLMNEGNSNTIETDAVTSREEYQLCELCRMEFSEEKSKHETSITHQLSLKHTKKHTYYHIPESNIGFQIMIKDGWNKDRGLGPDGSGKKFPIKTVLKQDRLCLGNKTSEKPRITHFQPFDTSAVENVKKSVRQRTLNKWQRARKEVRDKQKEIDFRREFY